jgi:hypothetical protein
MTISADGIVDWATFIAGAPANYYKAANTCEGFTCHSVEGYIDGLRLPQVFQGRLGVHFFLSTEGTLAQYYPLGRSCWGSGCYSANTKTICLEAEGVGDWQKPAIRTDLSEAQVQTLLRLVPEIGEWAGWTPTRGSGPLVPHGTNPNIKGPADRTLWEHNEVVLWDYNTVGPTACPSRRYNEFFSLIEAGQEDEMTAEERALLLAMATVVAGDPSGGDFQSIADALAVMNSLASQQDIILVAGLANTQTALNGHVTNHPGGTEVSEHEHYPGGVVD